MYINSISHYLPDRIICNNYINQLNGLTHDWIIQRTGVKERRKARETENTNTMAIECVRAAVENLPYPVQEVDLIIGATYTPYDTVATLAHCVQKEFNINSARVFTVMSACSSFINALEIVESCFLTNKASKALVVASEHNSEYNDYKNEGAGHLWGDGAAAFFISKEKFKNDRFEVIDVITEGLGNVGKSINAVNMRPLYGGIQMPDGKDVFINATDYMISTLQKLLIKNHLKLEDLKYIIPHQANLRIIKNIQNELNLHNGTVLINIEKFGNTGCASTPIVLSQNLDKIKKDELVALTVFGGGYSSGALIMKAC